MCPKLFCTFLLVVAFTKGISSSHREKSTEKPYAPPSFNYPNSSKHQQAPPHISDFTDPITGLNPFIDLEEGDLSNGRNVMEDERMDDYDPEMDFDPVEGETTGRKWDFDYNEKSMEKPLRRPIFEVEKTDIKPAPPTSSVHLQTNTEETITSAVEANLQEDASSDIEKNERESTALSTDTVICASVTVAVVAAIALLVGACWWKRKLKRISHSPVSMENGELKS